MNYPQPEQLKLHTKYNLNSSQELEYEHLKTYVIKKLLFEKSNINHKVSIKLYNLQDNEIKALGLINAELRQLGYLTQFETVAVCNTKLHDFSLVVDWSLGV